MSAKGPLLESNIKKKHVTKTKTKAKTSKAVNRARASKIIQDFGCCPISMEPMRRPVLPSSGQSFDEINLVRYCSSGKKRCPVSGAALKFTKGTSPKGQKVMFTVNFPLRNVIRQQAQISKVYIPPIDKEALLRDLRKNWRPETAKAVVDDTFLGYMKLDELRELLDEFSAGHDEDGNEEMVTAVFSALLAECLACRNADIAALAVEYIKVYPEAWSHPRVLYEALAVGQDPDCRGNVLEVLEARVSSKAYGASHAKAILSFETESVPVQQFQSRVAEKLLLQSVKGLQSPEADFEPIINLALRAREDLDGCTEDGANMLSVWSIALQTLRSLPGCLDDACLERLFWRENRMVLQHLAAAHKDLLEWHLSQHTHALSMCISALAGHRGGAGMVAMAEEMYTTDEDDYLSEEEGLEYEESLPGNRLPYRII